VNIRLFDNLGILVAERSRKSSVGIAKGYGLDGRGSIPGKDKSFSLLCNVQIGFGAHPTSYPMGTQGSLPKVKRPRSEADHLPPSNAEVKSSGAIFPLPHISSWHSA
jgi:hypothetical protein